MVDWISLADLQETGWLVYYYSHQKTSLPVRHVQKSWDEKVDPNLETMTYGLFTTCSFVMRYQALQNRDKYLFFFTYRNHRRVITGYYELGWYVKTGFINHGKKVVYHDSDIAFKARKLHFVEHGITLDERDGMNWNEVKVAANKIEGFGQRRPQRVGELEARWIKRELDSETDITSDYVGQIKHLENENLAKYGFRYPTLQQGAFLKRLLQSGFNTSIMDNYVF